MTEQIKNVVLVGRTGNGKSSTGNSILGQKLFISKRKAQGVTLECEMQRVAIQDGPIINVIDTPGLFDSNVSKDFTSREITRCLSMVEEGIHAVLFVLSARNRIMQEEESAFKTLQSIFDTKIVDYFIVVFTGGDELEEDGMTLDKILGECSEIVKRVVRQCGGRKVLFNNRTKDKDTKAAQLKQLLALVADVENQTGHPYTNHLHSQIKETKRLVAAEVKIATVEIIDNLKLEYDEKLTRMEQIMQIKIKEVSKAHIKTINELRETSVTQALSVKLEYDKKFMRMEEIMQIRIKEVSEAYIKTINELREALSVNQPLSVKLEYDEKLMRMEQITEIRIKEVSEAHIKAINELREALSVNQVLSVKLEYDEKLMRMEQNIKIKEISEAHIKAITELKEALFINQAPPESLSQNVHVNNHFPQFRAPAPADKKKKKRAPKCNIM